MFKLRPINFLLFAVFVIKGHSLIAQNALVQLAFEDAEKFYIANDFSSAIQYLDKVESEAGVTSKTLYLRVLIENKLLLENDSLYASNNGFQQLLTLRTHAKKYLDALADHELDDKYREVYRIYDNLTKYPKIQTQWVQARQRYIEDQKQILRIKEENRKAVAKNALVRSRIQELQKLRVGSIGLGDLRYNQLAVLQRNNEIDNQDVATVYLYRQTALSGRWVKTSVFFNNEPELMLETKTYMELKFTGGLLQINGLLGNKDRLDLSRKVVAKAYKMSKFFIQLEKGKTYYINTKAKGNGSIDISRVDTDAALRDMEDFTKVVIE